MRRQTSIDAEGLLEELGVFARRERQVFTAIVNARKPMTRTEVAKAMKVPAHYVCRPVLNLVRRRILIEPRTRPCSVTGFTVNELALNPWGRQLNLDLGDAPTMRPAP